MPQSMVKNANGKPTKNTKHMNVFYEMGYDYKTIVSCFYLLNIMSLMI